MKRPVKPDPQCAGGRHTAWCLLGVGVVLLAGCAAPAVRQSINPMEQLHADLAAAAPAPSPAPSAPPPAPAPAAPPPAEARSEARFDLIVNGAQTRDVFLAMVADTRYSMLMHPEVGGVLSVTLRDVTLREALESIREVYGYEFRIDGRRISIFPSTLQTRIFSVNYLHTRRQGRSDVRVSAGSAPANQASGGSTSAGSAGGTAAAAPDSSQVSTSSVSDLWAETAEALRSMVGTGSGRNVIVSAQSGTIAVRAMPEELRQVEAYLRVSRLAVERQVMLEAKIVEVELNEGFQSGVDWSILRSRGSIGQTSGNPNNPLITNRNGLPTLPPTVSALVAEGVALPSAGAGTIGLALAANGFSAVLGFLESHGDVQILSSPRVATLNNQKAVLKVGVDEYFVTNVSGGTITTGSTNTAGSTTLPTLTLTPFFSGIALDVTPQIDDANTITLHIHPSVTAVTEKTKQIDLGTIGNYRLPLASSSVNETDTVVRVTDGNIVAIGGLMQMQSSRRDSGLPGSADNAITRTLFGNNASSARKKELVVLIKPTIIRNVEDWPRTLVPAQDAPGVPRRVIALDAASAPPPAVK
ncbi:MAG: secretin N-terminal domain-containing protein [Burkholderiaceae bacterium]